MKRTAILALAALAACRPPASDGYVERIALDDARAGPQVLMTSPETDGAIWAPSAGGRRIVFGQPGRPPLLAIECAQGGAMLVVTRYAPADPGAKGMMALIGNGHVERLKVDALALGGNRGWLWQGRFDPADTRLDALTGGRQFELTIPGAGTLKLSPSSLPRDLIDRCRAGSLPATGPLPAASAKAIPPA